jgi:hypothetical protein
MHKQIQILVLASLLGLPSLADVTRTALFADHMVFQRGMPIVILGWADPGEDVQVRFGGQKAATKAADDGRWQVRLKPRPAEKKGRIWSSKARTRWSARMCSWARSGCAVARATWNGILPG